MVVASLREILWPLCQNGVLVSDSLAFRKTKGCKQHILLVQRCWWLKCFCDWMARGKSWLVRNNNNRILYETLRQIRLYCTNVATETQTSLTFTVGEWEIVEMKLDSRVIILLKQEDFCGAIALTYFVKNCLDLP